MNQPPPASGGRARAAPSAHYPSARDLAAALGGKTQPDVSGNYACRCPGPMHRSGDKTPSLSIRDGRNGKPLLYCFAGCDYPGIVAALTRRGLWPAFHKRRRL